MQKVEGSKPHEYWAPGLHAPAFPSGGPAGDHVRLLRKACRTKKPCDLQGFFKRLMGLEPTTFCMAIVCDFRMNA